MRDAIE